MRWQREWMDALQGATVAPTYGLRDTRDIERFEVYRASYEANLCGALRDTYPVVHRLVGEGYFSQSAHAYLRAHPSRCGDIHEFGANFASFLAALDSIEEVPYLPDVARLEWLAHQAFHAANAEPLTLSGLIELPPEACSGLCLLPSVRLMHSAFPVHRIWQVNQESWAGDPSVSLEEGYVRLAIYRVGLEIVLLPMEAEAYELANALVECGNPGGASEATEDAACLGRSLHTLVSAGLVTMVALHQQQH
jgi:Putative DNA-binding domain